MLTTTQWLPVGSVAHVEGHENPVTVMGYFQQDVDTGRMWDYFGFNHPSGFHVPLELPLCLTVMTPALSVTFSSPYMSLSVMALISASVSVADSTREVCGLSMRSPFISVMSSESLSTVST